MEIVKRLPMRTRINLIKIMPKKWVELRIQQLLSIIPQHERAKIITKLGTHWIESNYEKIQKYVSFHDLWVLNKGVWSLSFLGMVLDNTDTDIWDYISAWYKLTDEFCESHLDDLNYIDLVQQQHLSAEFYAKHTSKIDWIRSPHSRQKSDE